MTVRFAPHLWYAQNADEAARFYVSVIPGSSVDRVTTLPAETPSGPAGTVAVVEFTLAGAPVMAISRLERGTNHDPNLATRYRHWIEQQETAS